MDSEELNRLIHEFYGSPLSVLEIDDGETRLKMKKPVAGARQPSAAPDAGATVSQTGSGEADSGAGGAMGESSADAIADEGLIEVVSPLVGVFYVAPSPGEPPFVMEGDHVDEGDVLCLVEAMKMANEIKADRPGTVRRVVAKNGEAVGYHDVLMQIEAE
jgi:acetyl-CoA carboxylase biotin carboxyl carrier protein